MTKVGLGDLRESLAFDAPFLQDDGSGGQEVGWRERLTCKGHIRYLRGGESVQASRLSGRQPVVVTVMSSPAAREITTDWRMRDLRRETRDEEGDLTRGGFNIRAVVETEDRRFVEITAETGVAV